MSGVSQRGMEQEMYDRMKKNRMIWWAGCILLAGLFTADLMTGSASVSPAEVCKALFGGDAGEQTRLIVTEIRLPKALTAILAGIAVSVSGLLMQTLFRNPLAGPYVLGISSGASLGAALCVLSASSAMFIDDSVLGTLGLAGAAWLGAAAILAVIAAATRKIGDITVVLILGIMLGACLDAVVQILQFLSDEQSLKSYIVWTMGSLGNVSGCRLGLFGAASVFGLLMAVCSVKSLNLMLFGEEYAVSAGADVRKTRISVFIATVLLAGTATAFCGPLGFVGLAVPHIAKIVTGSADHRVLIPATVLCGGILMSACNIVAKLSAVPINAITSLVGIPVVVWVLFHHRSRVS